MDLRSRFTYEKLYLIISEHIDDLLLDLDNFCMSNWTFNFIGEVEIVYNNFLKSKFKKNNDLSQISIEAWLICLFF